MTHEFTQYKSITDIVKEYNHMYKVIKYNSPLRVKTNYDKVPIIPRIKTDEEKEDSIHRSVRRSKSVIRDYTLSNDFELFATFTFNPQKVDRYSFIHCASKMQGWLWRTSRYAKDLELPDFKYLIVPEFHKDGAIHFHALLQNYPKPLKKTKVIQDGKLVYNLPSFRFGFTNAKKIDLNATPEIFGYLTKYITKDMPLVSGRRRYWASKNLTKPITYHNKIHELHLEDRLNDSTYVFDNPYAVIYEIPKFE